MEAAALLPIWNRYMNFLMKRRYGSRTHSFTGSAFMNSQHMKSARLSARLSARFLRLFICGLLFLPFTSLHLHAESQAAQNQSGSPLSEKTGISFSGTYTEAVMVEGSEQITLEGDAWIETSRTRIEADSIRIYGENFRFADCAGNVVIVDGEQDITLYCTNLEYDRETLTAVLYGWVEMEDRKNQLTARGAYMKNEANEGITTIHIAARIRKHTDSGEMLCRTHSAVYSSIDEELVLTGNSEVYWNDDEYRADRITIDLQTNDIILQGDVSGTIAD